MIFFLQPFISSLVNGSRLILRISDDRCFIGNEKRIESVWVKRKGIDCQRRQAKWNGRNAPQSIPSVWFHEHDSKCYCNRWMALADSWFLIQYLSYGEVFLHFHTLAELSLRVWSGIDRHVNNASWMLCRNELFSFICCRQATTNCFNHQPVITFDCQFLQVKVVVINQAETWPKSILCCILGRFILVNVLPQITTLGGYQHLRKWDWKSTEPNTWRIWCSPKASA